MAKQYYRITDTENLFNEGLGLQNSLEKVVGATQNEGTMFTAEQLKELQEEVKTHITAVKEFWVKITTELEEVPEEKLEDIKAELEEAQNTELKKKALKTPTKDDDPDNGLPY